VQESFATDTPVQSWIDILPESTWSTMSSANVQKKLGTGVVIIEPDVDKDIAFDREIFVDMLGHGNMKYVVPMEGESLMVLNEMTDF
jgi:hypothetical protein